MVGKKRRRTGQRGEPWDSKKGFWPAWIEISNANRGEMSMTTRCYSFAPSWFIALLLRRVVSNLSLPRLKGDMTRHQLPMIPPSRVCRKKTFKLKFLKISCLTHRAWDSAEISETFLTLFSSLESPKKKVFAEQHRKNVNKKSHFSSLFFRFHFAGATECRMRVGVELLRALLLHLQMKW
jgi:hypothetical protein